MSRNRPMVFGLLGIAFAIAILAISSLFAGGGTSFSNQSISPNASFRPSQPYFTNSAGANAESVSALPSTSPASQAIGSLSITSLSSLLLLGAASIAIGFGSFFVISRHMK